MDKATLYGEDINKISSLFITFKVHRSEVEYIDIIDFTLKSTTTPVRLKLDRPVLNMPTVSVRLREVGEYVYITSGFNVEKIVLSGVERHSYYIGYNGPTINLDICASGHIVYKRGFDKLLSPMAATVRKNLDGKTMLYSLMTMENTNGDKRFGQIMYFSKPQEEHVNYKFSNPLSGDIVEEYAAVHKDEFETTKEEPYKDYFHNRSFKKKQLILGEPSFHLYSFDGQLITKLTRHEMVNLNLSVDNMPYLKSCVYSFTMTYQTLPFARTVTTSKMKIQYRHIAITLDKIIGNINLVDVSCLS